MFFFNFMNFKLITNNIDELGSWCHQRLVGVMQKYKTQQGGSMATVWAGTSPASNHQSALSHWRNFSGEYFLTWYLDTINQYYSNEGWEGLGAEVTKEAIKAVIHIDQHKKQTANMATKVVIQQRQWSMRATVNTTSRGQAHEKPSPCSLPTGLEDCWTHWLKMHMKYHC